MGWSWGQSLSTLRTSHYKSFKSSVRLLPFWLFTSPKTSFSFSRTMWDGYLKINWGVCLLQESGHACKISFNAVSVIPAPSHFDTTTKHLCHKNIVPPNWHSFADKTRERETEQTDLLKERSNLKKIFQFILLDLKYYLSIALRWIWLGLSIHSLQIHTSKTTVKRRHKQNILKCFCMI